ncbi:hypothetical protein D3C71_2052240 [compost metagenome]
MPGDSLFLEPLHHIAESVAGGIQIRMVDLIRIAQKHNLAAFTYPGHDGFHLMLG